MSSSGYTCDCGSSYTGGRCEFDINECVMNNGGCGIAPCYNLEGSYICGAYIRPGSNLTVPNGEITQSLNPLVLGSTNPGTRLQLSLVLRNQTLDTIRLSAGDDSNPFLYPCVSVVPLSPETSTNPNNYTVVCTLPPGCGTGYRVYLRAADLTLFDSYGIASRTNQTFSFPAPTFTPNTRSNLTNLLPTTDLQPKTVNSVRIEFSGTNFCPNELGRMSVRYGPASSPQMFSCLIVTGAPVPTTYTTIACRTSDFSVGIGDRLTLDVAGQTAVSDDTLTFPTLPVVDRASGCVDVGNTTTGCTTEGGQILTLYGSNFVNPLDIYIGGVRCADAVSTLGNMRATCTIPVGAGAEKPITVSSTGTTSQAVEYFSYATPTITSMTTTECIQIGTIQIERCPSHGGTILTIEGINFGASQARVLIGSALCLSAVQIGHRHITCITPPGAAAELGVVILQNGGDFGASGGVLSYVQCQPGYRIDPNDPYDCVACEEGKISEIVAARSCAACFPGKYSGLAPSSVCTDCDRGKTSSGSTSSCTNCTIGRFTATAGLQPCMECATGSYAPNEGSFECLPVDRGYYQDQTGMGSQIPCAAGYANPTLSQSQCVRCAAGTFTNVTGSLECRPCAGGTFQVSDGRTVCDLCVAGKFSLPRQAGCSDCGTGLMQPRSGAMACVPCPANSVTNLLHTLCDCDIGYFATSNDGMSYVVCRMSYVVCRSFHHSAH